MKNIYKTIGYLECILNTQIDVKEVKEVNENIKVVYDIEKEEDLILIYQIGKDKHIAKGIYKGKDFYKKSTVSLAIKHLEKLEEDKTEPENEFLKEYSEKLDEVIQYIQMNHKSVGLFIETNHKDKKGSEWIGSTITDSKTNGKDLYIDIVIFNKDFKRCNVFVIKNGIIEKGTTEKEIKNIFIENKNGK